MPATYLDTKGDSISFQTPTIEGTIFRRNKLDGKKNHPWKAEVTESAENAAVVNKWYDEVYEPSYGTSTTGSEASGGVAANSATKTDTNGGTTPTTETDNSGSGSFLDEPGRVTEEVDDTDVPLGLGGLPEPERNDEEETGNTSTTTREHSGGSN